jgi:hypothetical protein
LQGTRQQARSSQSSIDGSVQRMPCMSSPHRTTKIAQRNCRRHSGTERRPRNSCSACCSEHPMPHDQPAYAHHRQPAYAHQKQPAYAHHAPTCYHPTEKKDNLEQLKGKQDQAGACVCNVQAPRPQRRAQRARDGAGGQRAQATREALRSRRGRGHAG